MLKTEFKLNEERIIADGKYEPERIYRSVDNAFAKCNLKKTLLEDGTIRFSGTGHPDDYAHFGLLITSLVRKDWFAPYVDNWLWFNSDRGRDENDFGVEDILEFYRNKGVLESA